MNVNEDGHGELALINGRSLNSTTTGVRNYGGFKRPRNVEAQKKQDKRTEDPSIPRTKPR